MKVLKNAQYPNLAQLTIVIPSFCREEYLLRQIVYWAFTDATIIIADGSPVSLDSQVIELISGIKNIQYFHMVDSYTHRIRESCNRITTPYAMCLADDDLFLKEGLCSAVDRLNEDIDIAVCMGQVIGIEYDEKKMRTYLFPYGDSLENYHVTHQNPLKRIQLGIDNYRTATSYAVFRSSTFKDVWNSMQMTSCLEATEYEHAILTYACGNLSTVSNTYWLRSFECEPVDSVIDGTRKTTFDNWWKAQEYQQECEAFINRLSFKLSQAIGTSEDNARREIFRVIDYILSGRHIGLMNRNLSIMALASVLKIVKRFTFLHKCFLRFRISNLGTILRNTVMASARGAENASESIVKFGVTDQASLELKSVVSFVSSFQAAKNA